MKLDVVLMTTAEVAEACRVGQSTVRRWIDEGRIKAIRLPGGRLRIPRSEVDAILAVDPTVAGAA